MKSLRTRSFIHSQRQLKFVAWWNFKLLIILCGFLRWCEFQPYVKHKVLMLFLPPLWTFINFRNTQKTEKINFQSMSIKFSHFFHMKNQENHEYFSHPQNLPPKKYFPHTFNTFSGIKSFRLCYFLDFPFSTSKILCIKRMSESFLMLALSCVLFTYWTTKKNFVWKQRKWRKL